MLIKRGYGCNFIEPGGAQETLLGQTGSIVNDNVHSTAPTPMVLNRPPNQDSKKTYAKAGDLQVNMPHNQTAALRHILIQTSNRTYSQ